MKTLKVASVQFDLKRIQKDYEFWARVEALCVKAKQDGAELILFPEYFALSLLLLQAKSDFKKALRSFREIEKIFHGRFQTLSNQLDMAIVAGTTPVTAGEKISNRCFVYLPKKKPLSQDKLNMTRFESEQWGVSTGNKKLLSFKWKGVQFGIAVCFDIEFPKYVTRLVTKNIDIILVPSCTDDIHGYWRVRHCSQARAVESQSYVIMSSIVGGDGRFPEIFPHYGRAGFFSPCDIDFPEGGNLLNGTPNTETVYTASLDMDALKKVRKHGTVLNRKMLR